MRCAENTGMERRCIIYVFSGTGNTALVARRYQQDAGFTVNIQEINADFKSLPSTGGYDLVGLGYPVHAFNPPHIVIDFAKTMKTRERKDLFIFHTGGEGLSLNAASSRGLYHILSRNFTIFSKMMPMMPSRMMPMSTTSIW